MITRFEFELKQSVSEILKDLFSIEIPASGIQFQETKKEFEGDFTLVVFPFAKTAGKSPDEFGKLLGEELLKKSQLLSGFNVVKGFLNLLVGDHC